MLMIESLILITPKISTSKNKIPKTPGNIEYIEVDLGTDSTRSVLALEFFVQFPRRDFNQNRLAVRANARIFDLD